MSHRVVSGLVHAHESAGPALYTAKRRRPRGSKGAGVKFENELAKKLGRAARHGQWFEFFDSHGRGFAQTDILIFGPKEVFCLEAKLGNIEAGLAQLRELYFPILKQVYRMPARGIVLARHLTAAPKGATILSSLYDAVRFAALSGDIPILQWRERLPLAVPPGLGPNPPPIAASTKLFA